MRQNRLTIKGQVTIPKDVRDLLGLRPGEPVAFEREGDRVFLRRGGIDEVERRQRYDAALARIDRAIEQYRPFRTGRTTDDIMRELRGDEPLP